jgi:hypothetical protein
MFSAITTFFFALLTTSQIAHAAPSKAGMPGAYYKCSEPQWKGSCVWITPTIYGSQCKKDDPLRHTQSLGPDRGTVCITFGDGECRADSLLEYIEFPGKAEGLKPYKAMICGSKVGK